MKRFVLSPFLLVFLLFSIPSLSSDEKNFDQSELQDRLGFWAEPLQGAARLACENRDFSKISPLAVKLSMENTVFRFNRVETRKYYYDDEISFHFTLNQNIHAIVKLSRDYMDAGDVSINVTLGGKSFLYLTVHGGAEQCAIRWIRRILYLTDPPQDQRVWKEERMLPGGYLRTILYNPPPLALDDIYRIHVNNRKTLPAAIESLSMAVSKSPLVTIAILDSGFDYNHPAIAHKFDRSHIGWDFVDDDSLPYDAPGKWDLGIEDELSHGTAVAGVAGQGSSQIRLLPIRINFSVSDKGKQIRQAVAFASQRGARIVNLSFGIKSEAAIAELKKAIEEHPEILFVTASGNDGTNIDVIQDYPTSWALPNLISVAATDKKGCLAKWGDDEGSCWGPTLVHFAVIGKGVETIDQGGSVVTVSGTSFSSPLVANIAAKILLINPKLTPREVIGILGAATRVTNDMRDKLRFGGELSEKRALELARRSH